jgi:hypothetical protein
MKSVVIEQQTSKKLTVVDDTGVRRRRHSSDRGRLSRAARADRGGERIAVELSVAPRHAAGHRGARRAGARRRRADHSAHASRARRSRSQEGQELSVVTCWFCLASYHCCRSVEA